MKTGPNMPAVLLLIFLLTFIFSGCASMGLKVTGRTEPIQPGQIVDLESGALLTPGQLVEKLGAARVVFIGEYHQNTEQHERQLEIIKGLYRQNHDLAIGFEVFDRTQQELLDRWRSGRMDENQFRQEVLGKILNLQTLDVYYPLLKWARDNHVYMLALNAPRSITGKIARSGLASLSEKEKNDIARDIVPGPEDYRQRVLSAFKRHGLPPGDMDNFFTAQVVWDETMAETIVDFLESPDGRNMRLAGIFGNEHVLTGYGVPDRVSRRLDVPVAKVVMPYAGEDRTFSREDAEYIWASAPEPPRRRLTLGISLEDGPAGLVITSIRPSSEAERIGLKAGDRLLEFDGRDIRDVMDLHRAAIQGGAEKEHTLIVERDGRKLSFPFHFKEMEQ